MPRLDVRQTSTEEIGQVYVPQINWLLAVIVIGLVVSFRSSTALAAAYGIAVSGTMLVTTVLLVEVARRRWQWGTPMTFAVVGAFFIVDLSFFSANSLKIIEGGWFPLLVGAVGLCHGNEGGTHREPKLAKHHAAVTAGVPYPGGGNRTTASPPQITYPGRQPVCEGNGWAGFSA